jgi:hypothetical protein
MADRIERGLIPGKRYRMVLEAQVQGGNRVSSPSFEFTVPNAPEPLTNYIPTVVKSGGTARSSSTEVVTVEGREAYTATYTITSIDKPAKKSNNFRLYGSPPTTPSGIIKVSNWSFGDHRYYDGLKLTVSGTGPGYVDVVSSAPTSIGGFTGGFNTIDFSQFCHSEHFDKAKAKKKKWDYWGDFNFGSQDQENNWTPSNGRQVTGSYYVPAVARQTRIDVSNWNDATNITMSLPNNIIPTLSYQEQRLDAVRHVPLFAYKVGGIWKRLDQTAATLTTTPIRYDSVSQMPSQLPTSAVQNEINVSEVRQYAFTIVTYTYDGEYWNGDWYQTKIGYNSFSELGNLDNVVWSQFGTVV